MKIYQYQLYRYEKPLNLISFCETNRFEMEIIVHSQGEKQANETFFF